MERWKERTGSSSLHMCPPHHSHTGITNDKLGNLHGSQYSPEALAGTNFWLSLGDTRNGLSQETCTGATDSEDHLQDTRLDGHSPRTCLMWSDFFFFFFWFTGVVVNYDCQLDGSGAVEEIHLEPAVSESLGHPPPPTEMGRISTLGGATPPPGVPDQ